jgi:hypothetical protein
MEPITLFAIAAVAFLVLRGAKKEDKGPKTHQIHYEDLRTTEQEVSLRAGDAVEVVLSGVREQWGLLVRCPQEGCPYPLPDMLDIGVIADRGVVTYTLVATDQPGPWMVRLQFTLLGRPEGREVLVRYTPSP